MAAPQYILALDYGDKRVGVAVAHTVARLPRPLTTLPTTDSLLHDIHTLVAAEDAGLVVVGLPRSMDGGYSAQTKKAEAFAHELEGVLTVPVALCDETLTSVDAEAAGAGKGDVDAQAAALILERYLAEHAAPEAPHV